MQSVFCSKMKMCSFYSSNGLGKPSIEITSERNETERGISPLCSYHLGNRLKIVELLNLLTASSQKH